MERQRRRLHLTVSAAAFAVATLLATAGWADDGERPAPDSPYPELDQLIERKLDRLFDDLEGVLEDLPRYALPEITEEGDVIIRRLPRRPQEWPWARDVPDEMVDL